MTNWTGIFCLVLQVTPDALDSIAQQLEKSTVRARNLLFTQETDVLWCIETGQSSAKITWKRSTPYGMKFTLGSMTLVGYYFIYYFFLNYMHL